MRILAGVAAALAAAVALAAAPAGAAADVVWLCRPGLADDPCELPQDTTYREFDSTERVVTPPVDRDRGIDCFYVYPTVSNQLTPNATKARDPELVSIAEYQAARFSQHCRVYAPIYRQSTLLSIEASAVAPPDRGLAYGDVLEAWRSYLAHDNHGRGVVLIGHSQGTRWLRTLLRREIDPDPAQRRLLVGAILPGGNVTVADGRTTGGDFAHVPICTERAQIGCVVAYSTYWQDPPADSRFGRSSPPSDPADPLALPGGPGYQVACTDPRPLAGMPGALRLVTPSEPFATGPLSAGIIVTGGGPPPTADTTWVSPPDRGDGACRWIGGAHVLRLDPVGPSRRPNPFPDPTWGTHLVDVNLTLEPLVLLVGQQAERYLHPQVTLTRRCARGRLRVAIGGRDAGFAREVSFKLGRRRVARDVAAPFSRTLPRRAAARGQGTLRAVVALEQGAPARLVLERSLPDCAA